MQYAGAVENLTTVTI